MNKSAIPPLQKLTGNDLPVIFALNYAAMTCVQLRRFDAAETIISDTIALYGRLPPTLVARYALRVAVDNLDAAGSMGVLTNVFTSAELALPFVNMIRLTLVINGLSHLSSYRKETAAVIAELKAIVEDATQNVALRTRAQALLLSAGCTIKDAA